MVESRRQVVLDIPVCRAYGLALRAGCDVLRSAGLVTDEVRHTLEWTRRGWTDPVDVDVSVTATGAGAEVRIAARSGTTAAVDRLLDQLTARVLLRDAAERRGAEPEPEDVASGPLRLAAAVVALVAVMSVLVTVGGV